MLLEGLVVAFLAVGGIIWLFIRLNRRHDEVMVALSCREATTADDPNWRSLILQGVVSRRIHSLLSEAALASPNRSLYAIRLPSDNSWGCSNTIVVFQRRPPLRLGHEILSVEVNLSRQGEEFMVTFTELGTTQSFSIEQENALLAGLGQVIIAARTNA